MRKYLIAGLLVWLPLGITLLVVKLLVEMMDHTLLLLPPDWRPDVLLGMHIPGLGLVLAVAIVLVTGIVVANFLGRQLFVLWEAILSRIPFVRSIYTSVKQLAETVLTTQGQSFRKVLLVQYPRQGAWTLAFQTATQLGEVAERTGQELVAAYVPTTPNPTSGFVIFFRREEIVELDMSVDEGLKMVLSLGVVVPNQDPHAETSRPQPQS